MIIALLASMVIATPVTWEMNEVKTSTTVLESCENGDFAYQACTLLPDCFQTTVIWRKRAYEEYHWRKYLQGRIRAISVNPPEEPIENPDSFLFSTVEVLASVGAVIGATILVTLGIQAL